MHISLKSLPCDPSQIVLGESISACYLSDALHRLRGSASALVFPKTAHEVRAIISFAYENNIPITPRGAGTNLVGSTVPCGGIVLDLSKMNQILELDEQTLTVTAEAGTSLKKLQEFVEARGFFYPPDPGEKTATLGGNIATNAGGMRAVKYGVTRDYVRALDVVFADGTSVTLGSKNVKDACGLSLKNLIIGSEGTLAIITKCTLRVLPMPEKSSSILIAYPDLTSGIASVSHILRSNSNPTSVEFLERDAIELGERFTKKRFPCLNGNAYLLLTFDGNELDISSSIERTRTIAISAGAIDVVVLKSQKQISDTWTIRRNLVKAIESVSEQEPVDLVVPINRIAELIGFVREVEKKKGLRIISFGHAGDGNIHLCILRENRDSNVWENDKNACMKPIYEKAYALGGLTSGEHGIGIAKRSYFLTHTPKETINLMRQIKRSLDPKNILNPSVSYAEQS